MNQEFIDQLLIDPSAKVEGLKIYNYVQKSASSDFYADQFSENVSLPLKKSQPDYSNVPKEMLEAMTFFKDRLHKNAIIIELGGSKYQNRSGYPNYIYENYIPLDISYTSIKGYVDTYDRFGIVADACKLPFKDKSVDAIFTHTFLEHPLRPEDVLNEIDRVLKPGGFIIHSDAWNCRWWQSYGIVGVKKIKELNLKEKVIYLSAKITELKLFRQSIIVLKRTFILCFEEKKHNIELKYKKLTPNYNLHLYIDEDAASSIDPINVMAFYESRKYKSIPKYTFFKKIFFRGLNIYFQKTGL